MSKQIDEKVVSMEFDNRNFESNVKTTMSTLEKLKQSLHLKGATKGFEEINGAVGKVDMSPLSKGIETVQTKFSALQVIGVTALANITNSAVNAGKNLVKSLSFDQVTAGMSKYEQKTASVQTIMNATGKSIDEVNAYLEKLMWFSDETSYGFTDMTAALGQMTSSGGKIEKLIPLITGVANATAYAGKGAAEFSRVMYNLNQSYGAGHLQLMDWKSLELAGVGSKQLKQTLIDVGVELGKIKKGQVTIGTFAETLKDKWADTEVMEAAFGKFGEFSDAVHAMVESGEVDTAAEAIEKLSGKYSELSEKSFKSAQEAKSFTEAIDATKDAVSSQWMRTFELIFGDYEKAKVLWTELCGSLWEIFASGGEKRNAWLEKALSYSPLDRLAEKLEKITGVTDKVSKAMKDYEEVVNRIIRGDFGNGQSRFDKLTEAGYDWAHAQNLVNEKLGNGKRYATDYTEAQKKQTEQTVELSDAKLKELGLTEEEIQMYRDLEAESKKTGKSISELIDEMEKADGRTLLIGGFKNIGSGILGLIYAIRDAFAEIFPPMTAYQLYKLIEGFNKLTANLRLTDAETGELNETGERFSRIFKGVFAALDIVLTVVGGPIKIAFKAFMGLLKALDIPVLEFVASIGDAIVAFRDWIDSVLDFEKIFEKLGNLISPVTKKVKAWVDSFMGLPAIQEGLDKIKKTFSGGFGVETLTKVFSGLWNILKAVWEGLKQCYEEFIKIPAVQNGIKKVADVFSTIFSSISNSLKGIKLNSVISGITNFFKSMKDWLSGFGDYGKNGENLIAGLGNALGDGIKIVVDAITQICEAIYKTFTNFFDINSPSKVFFTLGKFCIAGLVAGLLFSKNDTQSAMTEIGGSLLEGLKAAVNLVVDTIKGLDLNKLLAIGGAVALFTTVHKLLNVMTLFGTAADNFGKVAKSASGFMDALTGKIKGPTKSQFTQVSENILKLAGAIAILAGSVYLLAQLKAGQLWNAVGAIAALALVIGLLAFAISKFDSVGDMNLGKIALALVGVSAALFIMAMAIKKLDFINELNAGPIVLTMVSIILALGLLMAAIGTYVKGETAANIDKAGWTLMKMSAVMLGLTFAAKQVSKLDPASMFKGALAITIFAGIITGLIAATKLAGPHINGVGGTILRLSAAMILLVFVIKLCSKMDPGKLAKGALCISVFGSLIAGLIAATRLASGKSLKGVGSTLIAAAAAIFLMGLTAKMMAGMSPQAFLKGITCVTLLGGVVVGLIAATKLAEGGNLKGVPLTLLTASICVAMLAGIAVILSLISLEGLAKGVTAVAILGAIVALMIWATRGASACQANITAMTTAIGIMAAAVFVLSLIPFEKLAPAVIGMGLLMGVFALMLKAAGSAKSAIGTILIMTLVVGLLAALIWGISKLEIGSTLETVGSLSILLLAMSLSLAVLSGIPAPPMAAIGALAVLGLVVAELAIILGVMSALNIEASMGNVLALSTMLVVMTGVLAVLALIAPLASGAFAAIGALAVLGLVVAELAIILGLMAHFDVEPSMETAKSLSLLLISMSAALVLLGAVGLMGPAAFIGIGALATLIAGIGGLLIGIGALMDKFPQLEEFLNKGIPVLEKIGYALGSFFGNIVGGFVSGMFSGFPEIGTQLSEFMTNAQPFIDGIKMVDSTAIEGVKNIAEMILILTGANILDKLTSWFTGGNSLADFATQLVPFGEAMADFSATIDGKVNESAVIAAANAGKVMVEMAKEIPNSGGILSWITGDNKMDEFGNQLISFGYAIVGFSEIVDGKVNDTAVTSAANAGKVMIEMGKEIPNTGGMLSWCTGDNDMATFGNQLVLFGQAIVNFSSTVDGNINEGAITAASNAGKIMIEMAKDIPNSGGMLSWCSGDNDLYTFGSQLILFGKAIVNFSSIVAGNINEEAVTAAANAGKIMVEMAKDIPDSGGMLSWFNGDNDMATFGSQMVSFGRAIKSFSNEVSGIDSGSLSSAITQTERIVAMAKGMEGIDFSNVGSFATNLNKLGMSGVTMFINAFKDAHSKVKSAGGEMIEQIIKGLESKQSTLESKIKKILTNLTKAIDDKKKKFKTAGEDAITEFGKGLKGVDITEDAKKAPSAAVTAIKDYYQDFYDAGIYLVDGFAAGISAQTWKAEAKAAAMAAAALQAAKEELREKSPSKAFYDVGAYAGEGFINAFVDYESASYKAGSEMAGLATDGLRSALSKVKDLVDSGIDGQPTIRPVLDLSDVADGAGAINGMFGMTPSVGVLSNVRAISSMMNSQNGDNDVLSAIKDLGSKLGKSSGDTYIIDGVTYDDGSNITDAVKTLVRAAKVERRV